MYLYLFVNYLTPKGPRLSYQENPEYTIESHRTKLN